MHLNRVAAALIVAAVLCAGCQGGPKPMFLAIPLTLRVTAPLASTMPPVPEVSPNLKLYVAQVQDTRAEKSKIGENREDQKLGARPVTARATDPAQFVREVLTRQLPTVGVHTIGAPTGANRILSVKLRQFYVIETDTYKATVDCEVNVADNSGQALFNGGVTGENNTFGRSFSAENYQQVLSDATVQALRNLLKDQAFLAALKVQ